MKKKISILGSTGSIGRQALEVIDSQGDNFEIYGLSAGSNINLFREQIKKYTPEVASVKNEADAEILQKEFPSLEILCGETALVEIAQNASNNMVLVAVCGIAGLFPVLAAINNRIDIALANKETLVAAGNIVMDRALKNNTRILPVDSEHSAIFQCLDNKPADQVKKLILTGSGGPFRTKTIEEIRTATLEQTLAHPNWSMGDIITVNSATLMNKGLEVIEAHQLFGVEYADIEVIIHPQSIVHSAVEFVDGSIIAQMGVPSMHIPIQYAFTYPDRLEGIETGSLDLVKASKLEFEEPDLSRFPCLRLAYEAGIKGGTCPAVLNALNEEAVQAFLRSEISLADIAVIVEKGLEEHINIESPDLCHILEADSQAREFVKYFLNSYARGGV